MPRKIVSRQQSWQTFKNSKGICRIDGKHPVYRSNVCVEHYVHEYLCHRYGFTRDPKTIKLVCKALVNAARYGFRVGQKSVEPKA